jgi:hypothetical protein
MPKVLTHALIWTASRGVYELHPADPLLSSVVPGEEEPWLAWLSTHTSFAFQGQASRLALRKESRPRGEGYWYAYHWHQWQARKRYLGRTATLTLARLEAVAQTLSTQGRSLNQPERRLSGSVTYRRGVTFCPCSLVSCTSRMREAGKAQRNKKEKSKSLSQNM